jgi:hypothetical protein
MVQEGANVENNHSLAREISTPLTAANLKQSYSSNGRNGTIADTFPSDANVSGTVLQERINRGTY